MVTRKRANEEATRVLAIHPAERQAASEMESRRISANLLLLKLRFRVDEHQIEKRTSE